mmetsp:Transcript_46805/g.100241  ORF Transcript_46805/g.100241 Transcript_46805/m.100241 type:complete len:473 (-) Transcript_46805:382-1800(-)
MRLLPLSLLAFSFWALYADANTVVAADDDVASAREAAREGKMQINRVFSIPSDRDIVVDPSKPELTCDAILNFAFPDLCDLQVTNGSITVRGQKLVYWRYKNKAGPSDRTPLLLVHGGPGVGHTYLDPMKQQACRGREVVFYDQVGAGQSAKPDLKDAPWLLTLEYYPEEVDALVTELGWKKFHFFGNSWGTVIGQMYGFRKDPRLEGIVLSGPLSDTQAYIKAQWEVVEGSLGALPWHVQAVLKKLGDEQAWGSKLYEAEDTPLTSFYTVRTTPTPTCFVASAPTDNVSQEIYVKMQGPSEFSVGGVMAQMNLTARLPEIPNPVLLTHGRYDTMRPAVIDIFSKNLQKSWRALLPRSGHCSMLDDPKLMNDVVGEFLNAVEKDGAASFTVPAEARDPGHVPAELTHEVTYISEPHSAHEILTFETSSLSSTSMLLSYAATLTFGLCLGAGLTKWAADRAKLRPALLPESSP